MKTQTKRGRGRPRKKYDNDNNNTNDLKNDSDETTIEVIKIYIDGKAYLKTKENILLDVYSYEILGMYSELKSVSI